jgi:hypothetical protein
MSAGYGRNGSDDRNALRILRQAASQAQPQVKGCLPVQLLVTGRVVLADDVSRDSSAGAHLDAVGFSPLADGLDVHPVG